MLAPRFTARIAGRFIASDDRLADLVTAVRRQQAPGTFADVVCWHRDKIAAIVFADGSAAYLEPMED